MCVSKDDIAPEDFEAFHQFVMTQDGEKPLTQLLNAIGIMLEAGGKICLAGIPGPDELPGEQPQQQPQALPPGIYPPNFSQPEPGTGQYL